MNARILLCVILVVILVGCAPVYYHVEDMWWEDVNYNGNTVVRYYYVSVSRDGGRKKTLGVSRSVYGLLTIGKRCEFSRKVAGIFYHVDCPVY